MGYLVRMINTVPFVGVFVILILVASFFGSVAAGIAFVFSAFQVESALPKIMPSWSAWHYIGAAVVLFAITRWLAHVLNISVIEDH